MNKNTVMQTLRERDQKTTIKVDPKDISAVRQATRLAKDTNSDIDLTAEQEGISTSNLNLLATEVKSMLVDALRESGMEVSVSEIEDIENNSFKINIVHPNDHTETYKFAVTGDNKLTISSKDYLNNQVVVLGEIRIKASGEPMLNPEIIKSNMIEYFTRTTISSDPSAEIDTAALSNLDDVKAGVLENSHLTKVLSVGHVDNEAEMMKQATMEMVEYGRKLCELFEHYEQLGVPVDFPHWFQTLVIKSRDYVGKAAHYLEHQAPSREEQEYIPSDLEKLRTLHNKVRSLESANKLTLESKKKIKKLISSYKVTT